MTRTLALTAALWAFGPLATAQIRSLEDFEFASSNASAAAGVTVSPEGVASATVVSGAGANANEGSFALGVNYVDPGSPAGFEGVRILRTFSPPIALARGYTEAGVPGHALTDLRFTLDIKGDPAFAAGAGANLWLFVLNGQGDRFRYINFTDPVLSSATYTDNRPLGLGLVDRDAGSTGPGTLDQIAAVELFIQNPNASTPITGTLFFDDLQVSEIASVWGPGVVIDGSFDDWDGQVPAAIVDASGDGGTGRDLVAVYLANDAANLYVRLESANADAFDGNEFMAIDGDANAATGFNFLGLGLGTDTLIFGASVAGQSTSSFNTGPATPSGVDWGPFTATRNIEYAVDLATTLPAGTDIPQSFPGGAGSLIRVVTLDSNPGASDTGGPGSYLLATAPVSTARTGLIDGMDLYDSDANAVLRTQDISAASSEATAANRAAGGPGGGADTALQVTHTNPAGAPFIRSILEHRIATPVNILPHDDITLDVFGSAALTGQNLVLGLRDVDGDSFAVGTGTPVSAEWNTVHFGPTSTWFDQNPGTGDDSFDASRVAGWWIAIEESAAGSGSTATLGYDNLQAVLVTTGVGRATWTAYR